MELDPYEEKLQIVSVFDLKVMSQQTHPDTEGLFANLQSENGFFTFSTIYIYIFLFWIENQTTFNTFVNIGFGVFMCTTAVQWWMKYPDIYLSTNTNKRL